MYIRVREPVLRPYPVFRRWGARSITIKIFMENMQERKLYNVRIQGNKPKRKKEKHNPYI